MDSRQAVLFAEVAQPSPLAGLYGEMQKIADQLPPRLHFGTSSWGFPGWHGLVYGRAQTAEALASQGLKEYVRHPLLTTVGIDRSYYRPIPAADLDRYAEQLPPDFRCCIKVPAQITSPIYGRGESAVINADFLSPDVFMRIMGEPLIGHFANHIGAIIFEFPPMGPQHRPSASQFNEGLDRLFSSLPKTLPYSVEIRNRELFCPGYKKVLAAHQVAHVYNYWSAMPMPGYQAEKMPLTLAPHVVLRLLLPPGTNYEQRKAELSPYDRLLDPDLHMRREVVDIIEQALATERETYVIVNNKAEGSAPLSIVALAKMLTGQHEPARWAPAIA